jgi:hypothetical protein
MTTHAAPEDVSMAIEGRVEKLLALMTLDEKLAQLGCVWSIAFITQGRFDEDVTAGHMRNGIGQVTHYGASTGLRARQSAELRSAIALKIREMPTRSVCATQEQTPRSRACPACSTAHSCSTRLCRMPRRHTIEP